MLRILTSLTSCGDVDVFLSTRWLTTSLCTVRLDLRTIVKVSLGGFRAFANVPFSASVSPSSTFCVIQKVRASLHDCVLLNRMSRDGGDATVVLVDLCCNCNR